MFIPSRTSVQFRPPGGQVGSLDAATPRAAGVMSGDDKEHLDTLWQIHQSQGGAAETIVIERQAAVDTSNLVTRDQLRAVVSAIPIEDLRRQISALPAPSALPDYSMALQQIDDRLRRIERFVDVLRQVTEINAAVEAAALKGEAA